MAERRTSSPPEQYEAWAASAEAEAARLLAEGNTQAARETAGRAVYFRRQAEVARAEQR